jgi:hypothetical protein
MPSALIISAALIALLLIPAGVLAQEAEPSEPAESAAPTESAEPAATETTEEAPPPAMAKVRFLHGAQAGPLDLYVDGELLATMGGFGEIGDFMEIPAGKPLLEIWDSGVDPVAAKAAGGDLADMGYAKAKAKLKADTMSTIVATPDQGGFTEIKVVGHKPKPAAGKALVSFVNLCSNCEPLTVVPDGTKAKKAVAKKAIAKKAKYAKPSKAKAVEPGELDLQVLEGKKLKKAADPDAVMLDPDTIYTLFGIGWTQADQPYAIVPAVDAQSSSVRFLNASRQPPVVDVYVDGKKVAGRLGPRHPAPKLANVLSGEHLVQVTEVGKKPADGLISEATVMFPAGTVASEIGAGESIEAVAAPASLAAKAATPQIRFAHIDPETPAVNIEIEGLDPVEGLAVGEWTDYMPLPGGESYLWIRPADDPGGIYHETPFGVDPGNSTVFVGGSAAIPTVEIVVSPDPVLKAKKQ